MKHGAKHTHTQNSNLENVQNLNPHCKGKSKRNYHKNKANPIVRSDKNRVTGTKYRHWLALGTDLRRRMHGLGTATNAPRMPMWANDQ